MYLCKKFVDYYPLTFIPPSLKKCLYAPSKKRKKKKKSTSAVVTHTHVPLYFHLLSPCVNCLNEKATTHCTHGLKMNIYIFFFWKKWQKWTPTPLPCSLLLFLFHILRTWSSKCRIIDEKNMKVFFLFLFVFLKLSVGLCCTGVMSSLQHRHRVVESFNKKILKCCFCMNLYSKNNSFCQNVKKAEILWSI